MSRDLRWQKIAAFLSGMSLFVSAATVSTPPSSSDLPVKKSEGMSIVIQDPFHSKEDTIFPIAESDSVAAIPEKKELPKSTRHYSDNGKTLYLTFDDGPVEGTENLLRVLKEEGVKATLFCVGRHAKKRPYLYRRAASMPNLLIANHTYSHANGRYSRFYSNLWQVMSDVEHAQLIFGGPKYLRLAGRNVWRLPEVRRNDGALSAQRRSIEIPKYEQLAKEGFYIYGWDVEWHFDHASGRPVEGARRLADRISSIARHQRMARKNKVVLLAHDFMFKDRASAEKLRSFIRIMRQRGWKFQKIDHYSQSRPEPLRVAKYYGKAPTKIATAAPVISPALPAVDAISSPKEQKDKESLIAGVAQARSMNVQKTAPTSVAGKNPQDTVRRVDPLATLSTRIAPPVQKPVKKAAGTPTYPARSTGSLQARLNEAIRKYDSKQMERLIGQGARVNRRDEFGRTPLNTAIKANSIFLVKKLLSLGADVRIKDAAGINALAAARTYRRKAIESYLLAYTSKGRGGIATIARNDQVVPMVATAGGAAQQTSQRRDPLKFLRQ